MPTNIPRCRFCGNPMLGLVTVWAREACHVFDYMQGDEMR